MKISRVKTALCLTAALAVSSGALLPASAAVKDGTYLANVSLHNQMFRIYEEDNSTCRLTVKDGRMTALIRLNGTGYDRLYAGTKENAPADSAGRLLPRAGKNFFLARPCAAAEIYARFIFSRRFALARWAEKW